MTRLIAIPVLWIAAGCKEVPVRPLRLDPDGDHWSRYVDCDEDDVQVNPDAVEVCDGVDNDCDGEIDEDDAVDAQVWFADYDGDGFGAPEYPWQRCEQPDGYVDNDEDCDDQAVLISPAGIEECDEIDNDCDGSVDELGALFPTVFYRDYDEDGFGDAGEPTEACEAPEGFVASDEDCNDGDPAIHPDADELCDDFDVDEDCDGLSDDADSDAVGTSTWFIDADGDTYGNFAPTLSACDPPAGYTDNADDCDDAERKINPGSFEICGDGLDNDCDTLVDGDDDAEAVDWYADTDADGYGDPNAHWGLSCDAVPAHAANADDCDDAAGGVYPGASEVWYDGVDQDCGGDDDFDADRDGYASDAYGGLDCDDTDAAISPAGLEICGDGWDNDCDGVTDACEIAATWSGSAGGDLAGGAVAMTEDLTGDGRADVLIGADREDTAGTAAGAVYLVAGGTPTDMDLETGAYAFRGVTTGDHAGWSVAGPGDVDGDGSADLFVGAYSEDSGGVLAGAAYLLSGPFTAGGALDDGTARFLGEAAGDEAGYAVAAAGDVDADGFADLLIGAWKEDAGGGSAGAAYLVHGPITGARYLWTADAKLVGEAAGDQAGGTVAGAGDVDGDGADDLLIGAPYEHSSGAYTGALYLLTDTPSGEVDLSEADARWQGVNGGDSVGSALAGGGDWDGDGLDDVLVGAPEEDAGGNGAGAVYVLLGPLSGGTSLSAAHAKFVGENADDAVGSSVAWAGDLDGSGTDDALFGAARDDVGGSDAGAAYFVLGALSGTVDLSLADGKAVGLAAGDGAGAAVAGGRDVDGDGVPDAVVGVPEADVISGDEGVVWLLLGGGW